MHCLLGYLESQRWRLSESNCVLSIYRLHNSLGSLSLGLLDLMADFCVYWNATATYCDKTACEEKNPSWQTALFNFLFPSVSQLAQPLLGLWGEHLWIVLLDINQEILKHCLKKKTRLFTISKLKCLKLASSEDVIHCIPHSCRVLLFTPNHMKSSVVTNSWVFFFHLATVHQWCSGAPPSKTN